MIIHDLHVQRVSIFSHRPFTEVVLRVEEAIGHPDMPKFGCDMANVLTAAAK